MTDITKLAREILSLFKTMAKTMDDEYEEAKSEFIVNSVELAKAVIDRHNKPSQGESRMTISSKAKAEQREKDTEIAQDHDCDEWPGMCNCRGKIAKAIRDAKS